MDNDVSIVGLVDGRAVELTRHKHDMNYEAKSSFPSNVLSKY